MKKDTQVTGNVGLYRIYFQQYPTNGDAMPRRRALMQGRDCPP